MCFGLPVFVHEEAVEPNAESESLEINMDSNNDFLCDFKEAI